MIHWLLTRLEKNPRAHFAEWELRRQDSAAFESLVHDGLIRRLPAPRLGESYVDPSGRLLTLVPNPDGTVEGIDEDDPEYQPATVTLSELASWTVDLDALCRRFREANSLSGKHGALHERLYMLGEVSPGRAAVLALLVDEDSGLPLLRSLPALGPSVVQRFLVACPSLGVLPQQQIRLEQIDIEVFVLRPKTPFALPRSSPARSRAAALGPRSGQSRSRQGRPRGRTFGAMLDCWFTCYQLHERFDSTHEAYNAIEACLERRPVEGIEPPLRTRYSRARSYAAKAREQRGGCLWYRHQEGPPSELMSE